MDTGPMLPTESGRNTRGEALLEVVGLTVDMLAGDGSVRIVDSVSFSVGAGERVALVGESGSGKSVTARALMRLDRGARLDGRVVFDGTELLGLTDHAMNRRRGIDIGMVFQDPTSTLDPLMSIGDQVAETLRIRGVPRAEARSKALTILQELGVDHAAARMNAFPHEFSGGMRQRVGLAMALIGEPRLLIADEPTTALDVRVQEQVLDLLDLVSQRRRLAVLLITHDLGIVAGFADRVIVMYAGRIVEDAPVDRIFASPGHPYTKGLLGAVPRVDQERDRLTAIPGTPPQPWARPHGCAFHPRCPAQVAPCSILQPVLRGNDNVRVACHLFNSAVESS